MFKFLTKKKLKAKDQIYIACFSFIYFILTSVLLNISSSIDFNEETKEAIFQAYPNLFVYPIYLGFLLPIVLVKPIRFILKFYSNKIFFGASIALLVLCMILSIMDFSKAAIWDIRHTDNLQYQNSTFIDQSFDSPIPDNASLTLDSTVFTTTLNQHFLNPEKTFSKFKFEESEIEHLIHLEIGEKFTQSIEKNIQKNPSYQSYTGIIYILSFFTQAFGFLLLFILIGFIFKMEYHQVLLNENLDDTVILKKEYKESILFLIIALFLFLIWYASFLANQFQKLRLTQRISDVSYSSVFHEPASIFILILIISAILFLAYNLFTNHREKIISTLITFFTFFSAVLIGFNPSILIKLMTNNTTFIFTLLSICLFLIIFMTPEPKRMKREDDNK